MADDNPKHETQKVLFEAIKKAAGNFTSPSDIEHLANAYAVVAGVRAPSDSDKEKRGSRII